MLNRFIVDFAKQLEVIYTLSTKAPNYIVSSPPTVFMLKPSPLVKNTKKEQKMFLTYSFKISG